MGRENTIGTPSNDEILASRAGESLSFLKRTADVLGLSNEQRISLAIKLSELLPWIPRIKDSGQLRFLVPAILCVSPAVLASCNEKPVVPSPSVSPDVLSTLTPADQPPPLPTNTVFVTPPPEKTTTPAAVAENPFEKAIDFAARYATALRTEASDELVKSGLDKNLMKVIIVEDGNNQWHTLRFSAGDQQYSVATLNNDKEETVGMILRNLGLFTNNPNAVDVIKFATDGKNTLLGINEDGQTVLKVENAWLADGRLNGETTIQIRTPDGKFSPLGVGTIGDNKWLSLDFQSLSPTQRPTATPLQNSHPPMVALAHYVIPSREQFLPTLTGLGASASIDSLDSFRLELVLEESSKPIITHVVSSGDTLTTIAQRYNVTSEQLALVNGINLDSPLPNKLFVPYPWSETVKKFLEQQNETFFQTAVEIYGEPCQGFLNLPNKGDPKKIPVYPMRELVQRVAAEGYWLDHSPNNIYPWGIYVDFKQNNVGIVYPHEFAHGYLGNSFDWIKELFDPHDVVNLLGKQIIWENGGGYIYGSWVSKLENPDKFAPKNLLEYLIYKDPQFLIKLKNLYKESGTTDPTQEKLTLLAEKAFPGFTSLYNLVQKGPETIKPDSNLVFSWDNGRLQKLVEGSAKYKSLPLIFWVSPAKETIPFPWFGTGKGSSIFLGFDERGEPIWRALKVVEITMAGDNKIGPSGSIPCMNPADCWTKDSSATLGSWGEK